MTAFYLFFGDEGLVGGEAANQPFIKH